MNVHYLPGVVGSVHNLLRDAETRGVLELPDVGTHRSVTHPQTEVLCVAYATDGEPPELWTPGQPIPEVYFEAARNPEWCVVAHNNNFECLVEQFILAPRYGWR